MKAALFAHWPEYLMEAGALGLFMISAAFFVAIFEHPSSPLRKRLQRAFVRRALIGAAMGATAIALIYSPWGERSGAHMNPAVTLAFVFLGKIQPWDAAFYVVAQFIGGLVGLLLAKWLLGPVIAHPAVNYVVTEPGSAGLTAAFAAEGLIACGMMLMVLWTTNDSRFSAYTGAFAGALVFIYITLEAPYSGMSMNPARTSASAFPARSWQHSWIYFIGPPLGMVLAAEIYAATRDCNALACPKLYHGKEQRCIFCGYPGRTGHVK